MMFELKLTFSLDIFLLVSLEAKVHPCCSMYLTLFPFMIRSHSAVWISCIFSLQLVDIQIIFICCHYKYCCEHVLYMCRTSFCVDIGFLFA